jgi:hypothetical protein
MTARAVGVLVAVVAVCALIGLYIALYLTVAPPSVAATPTPVGSQLYLATVPAAEPSDPHNTWVSYYQVDANSQHWVHATTYLVPANSWVHMTIYQYDGDSGLRNEFLSQVRGTPSGTFLLNGKATVAIAPANASHVFSVPQLGLSVPLEGVPSTAKNPCGNAPCSLSNDHQTISFTFHTGGKGLYRWQCFVPCAAGFIQGFGGPMQTVGYMGGFLKVV